MRFQIYVNNARKVRYVIFRKIHLSTIHYVPKISPLSDCFLLILCLRFADHCRVNVSFYILRLERTKPPKSTCNKF